MFVCVWGAIYSSVLRCLQGVVCVLLELCAFVGLTVFAGCLCASVGVDTAQFSCVCGVIASRVTLQMCL